MHFFCILITVLLFSNVSRQQVSSESWVPNVNLKVIVCPNKQDSLSLKVSPNHCQHGLKAVDKNYSIISFRVSGEKLCDATSNKVEGKNTGAAFNEVQWILNKACLGSILKFTCITAKDKNGRVYTLLPFTLQL